MLTTVKKGTDPSQNYIERYAQPLDAIFLPQSVAVIGAKDDEGSVGKTIFSNLLSGGFKGRIYPINPKRSFVLGQKTYPTIASIPEQVDLAVIVTPAKTVPGLVAECVDAHVKGAIIISAGFKELGISGIALEQEILQHARKGKMPIIGPNCLGVMNPSWGLNATFAKGIALPGNLAFISQSGAMCTSVLDWSFKKEIGFSAFVSIGSMADVNWGHLIDYLGGDPQTESILLYMETIGDPRSFLSAAREISLEKPIIVIKAGRSQAAAQAAVSHTGSLAGSDEVFDIALERVGVLRVNSIADLFSMASVLARQAKPKGPHLAIVTNAGGPAVLATDAAVLNGAELAQLNHETIEKLNIFLPPAWSHGNPVDILGDASPQAYAKTIEVLAKDPQISGILAVLSPQDMTDPSGTAEMLKPFAHLKEKPLFASWMGGDSVAEGVKILTQAGVSTFDYPDDAARTFAMMWHYSQTLKNQYEVALSKRGEENPAVEVLSRNIAQELIDRALRENRTLLTEYESKKMLATYGIPIVETKVASTVEEAVKCANELGYPIVLKLHSDTITHKSDVGGVKLNLVNTEDVTKAFHEIEKSVNQIAGAGHFGGVTVQRMVKKGGFELILGSTTDAQFGPVILFGTGGQFVEVFKDRALALPPLTPNLALQMMQKTKIYEALLGVRGIKAVDKELLARILVRFSQMIVENRRIKECDINPLVASSEEIIALDARIALYDPKEEIPPLAIRPYPLDYTRSFNLKNGILVTLRPILPEDEEKMVLFHKELSENSVRQRYFEFMSLNDRIAHERLLRICFNDYDREIGLIAEVNDPTVEKGRVAGVARLSKIPGTQYAQLKLTIVDAFHNMGLGTELIKQLIAVGKAEKLKELYAYILSENEGMIHICQKLGFRILPPDDRMIVCAILDL